MINYLDEELKFKPQENWDNSGLQIGNMNSDINKVIITLDLDLEIVKRAIEEKANLIITHHPFIFNPIKSIDLNTNEGMIIQLLIMNNINLYSLHTSYDMAEYGVNYELSLRLGIYYYDILHPVNIDRSGYGGIANIEPINILEYAKFVKKALNCDYVKLYCNDTEKIINRVAFCGGSGSDFIIDAINKKAQVYVTGDIKYHNAQEALKNNLFIIDAGHFNTEYHSLHFLKSALHKLNEIEVILLEKNTIADIII